MRLVILTTACLITASSATVFGQRGDFNGDGQYSCHDVDRLWQEFDSPSPDLATFDLNMDGVLDGNGFGGPRNDFGELLGIVSQHRGYPIVPGDFDFNGTTDRRDFLYVTANYNRGHVDGYCAGDIDNDGYVNAQEANTVAIFFDFSDVHQTEIAPAYTRDGDGLVFARSDLVELIAYPEPFEPEFSDRFVATRIVARMRDPSHEITAVDQVSLDGELLQIWVSPGPFPAMPTPYYNKHGRGDVFQAPFEHWGDYDSHILLGEPEIAVGDGGFPSEEFNDKSNPFGLAEELELSPSDPPFVPTVGMGPIETRYNVYGLYQNEELNVNTDWTEVPLVRAVTTIGEDGRPGFATLSAGLQGIIDDGELVDVLPEMGIITDLPIPFFTEKLCDRDFDGDCDFEDLPQDVFASFTDKGIDDWLSDSGTVRGDTDLDGKVDATDLNQVGVNWQQEGDFGWRGGDFDGNGVVNAADLNELGLNWRFGVGVEPSTLPEPVGVNLVMVCCACFVVFRRPKEVRRPTFLGGVRKMGEVVALSRHEIDSAS